MTISNDNPIKKESNDSTKPVIIQKDDLVNKINDFYKKRNNIKQKTFIKLFQWLFIMIIITDLIYLFLYRFDKNNNQVVLISYLLSFFVLFLISNIFFSIPSDVLDLYNDNNLNLWIRILFAFMSYPLMNLTPTLNISLRRYLRYIQYSNVFLILVNFNWKLYDYRIYNLGVKLCISFILCLVQFSIAYLLIGFSSLYVDVATFENKYTIPNGNFKVVKDYYNPIRGIGRAFTGVIITIIAIITTFRETIVYINTKGERGMDITSLSSLNFTYCTLFWVMSSVWVLIFSLPTDNPNLRTEHTVFLMTHSFWLFVRFRYGPKVIYNFFTKPIWDRQWTLYESEEQNLLQNGIFIIQLLDEIDVQLNSTWWVHYDDIDKPIRHDALNHKKYWYEGKIVFNDSYQTGVKLIDFPNMPLKYFQKRKKQFLQSQDVLKDWVDDAVKRLRCIDWENMSIDLFCNSVRDSSSKSYYNYSRFLFENEKIDYFISHSWLDDGYIKYNKLEILAEKHKLEYGKYPTFWFDKVCIDQKNILDGLRLLPINLLMCNKMLILSGPTYTGRLWCVWEIFTLVTFLSLETAINRTIYISIDENIEISLQSLQSFNVMDCRCYDPNEETKLFTVIEASGRFNSRVHEFASALLKRHKRGTINIGKIIV